MCRFTWPVRFNWKWRVSTSIQREKWQPFLIARKCWQPITNVFITYVLDAFWTDVCAVEIHRLATADLHPEAVPAAARPERGLHGGNRLLQSDPNGHQLPAGIRVKPHTPPLACASEPLLCKFQSRLGFLFWVHLLTASSCLAGASCTLGSTRGAPTSTWATSSSSSSSCMAATSTTWRRVSGWRTEAPTCPRMRCWRAWAAGTGLLWSASRTPSSQVSFGESLHGCVN